MLLWHLLEIVAKLHRLGITHEQVTAETVFVKIDVNKKCYEASLASFSKAVRELQ